MNGNSGRCGDELGDDAVGEVVEGTREEFEEVPAASSEGSDESPPVREGLTARGVPGAE